MITSHPPWSANIYLKESILIEFYHRNDKNIFPEKVRIRIDDRCDVLTPVGFEQCQIHPNSSIETYISEEQILLCLFQIFY